MVFFAIWINFSWASNLLGSSESTGPSFSISSDTRLKASIRSNVPSNVVVVWETVMPRINSTDRTAKAAITQIAPAATAATEPRRDHRTTLRRDSLNDAKSAVPAISRPDRPSWSAATSSRVLNRQPSDRCRKARSAVREAKLKNARPAATYMTRPTVSATCHRNIAGRRRMPVKRLTRIR